MWAKTVLETLHIYICNLLELFMKAPQKLTSVRLDVDLFQAFKLACIQNRFSFQKLATRAIFLYLSDEDFRRKVHNLNDTDL